MWRLQRRPSFRPKRRLRRRLRRRETAPATRAGRSRGTSGGTRTDRRDRDRDPRRGRAAGRRRRGNRYPEAPSGAARGRAALTPWSMPPEPLQRDTARRFARTVAAQSTWPLPAGETCRAGSNGRGPGCRPTLHSIKRIPQTCGVQATLHTLLRPVKSAAGPARAGPPRAARAAR